MQKLALLKYGDYLNRVLDDDSGQELQTLLDAVSTNTTSFYRERDHFDFIRGIVNDWTLAGHRTLRFWSAASSTGEEPYTLAIELQECIGKRPIDARILATDINTQVLIAAQKGIYAESKVAPVPKKLLKRYFTRQSGDKEEEYVVRQQLKEMILFRQFNLMIPPYPIRSGLDMILCRNVMIYFDSHLKAILVAEFERLLKPGGYLLIGHAESLNGMVHNLKCIKPSIYKKG